MKPRRNNWPLIPGARLTFWRGSRKLGIPPSFVWLGHREWLCISLGRKSARWISEFSIAQFGPITIERFPR